MNESIYNGRFVFLPGSCPNCGEIDSMMISHQYRLNKLNMDDLFFKCRICKDTVEYDWWVIWTFVKDIERERLINKA